MRSLRLAAALLPLALAPFLPRAGGTLPRRIHSRQQGPEEAQPVDIGDVQTTRGRAINLVNDLALRPRQERLHPQPPQGRLQRLRGQGPPKTKNFTLEKNLPLTIGILLDTSGSQINVLPLEQQSGAEFLKDVLTPKDEAFLISFDINVNLLADYTNSPREIRHAMDSAVINTGAGTGSVTGNGTARGTLLFDAVYLAAHEKLRQEAGRKILVLLTDGGDQGSQENLKTATEAAQKANAIVYVILLADHAFYGGGFGSINLADSGARDMERLASETGGRVINVGNNGKKLEEAFAQIQDELRTQYLASYTPTNPKIDGTFRTLNITCQPGEKIQARKGYYAMADALGPDN